MNLYMAKVMAYVGEDADRGIYGAEKDAVNVIIAETDEDAVAKARKHVDDENKYQVEFVDELYDDSGVRQEPLWYELVSVVNVAPLESNDWHIWNIENDIAEYDSFESVL